MIPSRIASDFRNQLRWTVLVSASLVGGPVAVKHLGPTYLKRGPTLKLLHRSIATLERLAKAGTIRRKWFDTHWRYHADDVRAFVAKRGEGRRDRVEVETTARALIREGRLDGDIAQQCGLRLREVERLRLSIGQTPTAQTYAPVELAPNAPEPERPLKQKKRAAERESTRPPGSDIRGARDRALAKLADIRARVRERAFGKEK